MESKIPSGMVRDMNTFTITTQHTLQAEHMRSIFIDMIEANPYSSSWAQATTYEPDGDNWHAVIVPATGSYSEDDYPDGFPVSLLNADTLADALQKFALTKPLRFLKEIVYENHDGETCDVLLQYAVLTECIYG